MTNTKKIGLALTAVLALSSSTFAADTLADAFKNGKFTGDVKAWYWDRGFESTAKKDADLLTIGTSLTYITDSFKGFKAGVNFQSSNAAFASEDAKQTYIKDQYGPGAVLSEAYLAYGYGKTNLKVGRQFINGTPLIGASGSRVIKQSFEGVSIVNTDISNTQIAAYYLTKFLQRTSQNGEIGQFRDDFWYSAPIPGANSTAGTSFKKAWKTVDSNVYSLMVRNKSIQGLTLTGQFLTFTDLANLYFVEAAYKGMASKFNYGLFANYQITDFDSSVSDVDSGYYAFKAALGMGGFKTYAAYSKIDDDTSAIPGAGGAPYISNYVNSLWTPSYFNKGTKAYAIDANYSFKKLGLNLGARFVNNDFGSGVEQDAISVYTKYKFKGALKGLMAMIGYEDTDSTKANADYTKFRANFTYKF